MENSTSDGLLIHNIILNEVMIQYIIQHSDLQNYVLFKKYFLQNGSNFVQNLKFYVKYEIKPKKYIHHSNVFISNDPLN